MADRAGELIRAASCSLSQPEPETHRLARMAATGACLPPRKRSSLVSDHDVDNGVLLLTLPLPPASVCSAPRVSYAPV